MNDSIYIIRNYQPADFKKYLQLQIAAEKLEPTGRCLSSQVLDENLGRPDYSPEQDLFLAETAGNLIGYLEVLPELTIGRVILNCWVHPEHRRQGIATQLLDYALQRAKELGAEVAQIEISQDNTIARRILTRRGFNLVRRFLHLRLNMARVHRQDMEQAALGCRHLQRGEEDKLTRIQNRSFASVWGYNPNTVTAITYRTNLSNPQDVVLTCDGDKVTGYCWTEITDDEEAASGTRKGRIFMLGVDPTYRGKGVGKKALLAGLAHLQEKGLAVAELTVDSENKVACALYQMVGFEVGTSSMWYEKRINQGTGAK
ncbi:GNAT family N-acetyltransferase [Chloroflexota bacterium]